MHIHPRIHAAQEIRYVALEDDHLTMLSTYVMHGWPSTRSEVIRGVQQNWSFRDEVAVIDGIAMKGRNIIITASLQKRALDKIHDIHMGIEKTRLLAHGSAR